MATVPGVVPNVHWTAAGASGLTVAWGAPNNGGATITEYYVTIYYYNNYGNYDFVSTFGYNAGTSFSYTVTPGSFVANPQNYIYIAAVQALNSVGWSTIDVASRSGTTAQAMALHAATTFNQSFFETVAVSEGGSPLVTPPSAFGVALRLNQGTDFVFGQLTRRATAADPDAVGANPVVVMNNLQPITRMALGEADVVPGATDSEKLAGEIASGTLASKKGVVAHTSGASTFTLTNAWTADRSATIYTMAVLNNMPIGYASGGPFYQDLGSVRRTLIWTYDLPTPIGVGPGDTFTTTVTIAF